MFSLYYEMFKEILKAWREGARGIRVLIAISGLLLTLGGFVWAISPSFALPALRIISAAVTGVGAVGSLAVYWVQKSKEEAKEERKLEAVEKRAKENPKETQVAWELARVKLESYLNRDLSQVKSIFFLTVVVMTVGFALIGIGAYQAFKNPDHFKASVLSSISGVVVSFIGGTFLVLYKSTMAQA